MSDAHAHAHHGPDHVPHVSPLSVYMKTFGVLIVLTAITVGVSRIDLGTSTNLLIALVIATIKASTVSAFFMHLAHDHKFHTIIFVTSVVFLLIFVIFTMADTEWRGRADATEKQRPLVTMKTAEPFAKPTGLTTVPLPSAAAPPAAPASASAPPAAPAVPPPAPEASAAPSASAAPAAVPQDHQH
jgi:cytochrome c oxidase subunit 4